MCSSIGRVSFLRRFLSYHSFTGIDLVYFSRIVRICNPSLNGWIKTASYIKNCRKGTSYMRVDLYLYQFNSAESDPYLASLFFYSCPDL